MRHSLIAAATLPCLLAACGGGATSGGGGVATVPTPSSGASAAPPAVSAPATSSAASFETAEYRRANAAVQAKASAAYGAGATGAGVTVGVIDSGVDTGSAEFAGRISPLSRDYAAARGIQDPGGHGTAVASVLLGARNDGGIHGVAFGATLLALRTDTPGSCPTTTGASGGCLHADNTIAAALDGAVAGGARVVNMSMGGSPANNTLRAAIGRATAAGTIIVISAGNDGLTNPAVAVDPDMLAQIALDPLARGLVIIAGAVDEQGVIADFSNRAGVAAATYLTALGSRVRSVDQTGAAYLYSGTSFSAPVIAGAAALLAQAFPNLSAAQIVALLYRSAADRGAGGVDAVYGQGELDLARAFAPQGALSLAGSGAPVSLADNATLGGAMGDAGAQGALMASVTDAYDRPYRVDLSGTIRRSVAAAPLHAALGRSADRVGFAGAWVGMAVSVERAAQPQTLLPGRHAAAPARVLAGAVTLALDASTQAAFAAGQSAGGLLGARAGDFLLADRTLDRLPGGAAAVRRTRGPVGLTIAAEGGVLRLWEAGDLGPLFSGWRRYPYAQTAATLDWSTGPLSLRLGATQLRERATVLGGRFGPAFGGGGATTRFTDAEARLRLGRWDMTGAWQQGQTRGSAGMRLRTRALRLDVGTTGLFAPDDRVALRYSEPLRVTDGSVALFDRAALSLAPRGAERDWELAYARALGGGWLGANAYVRAQPGHVADAPTDVGLALRWGRAF